MIRAFEERDYPRMVAISALANPDNPASLEVVRYRDRTWDPGHRKLRLVFESDGQVLGWGQVMHTWWAFHPRRYALRIEVDPAGQRRGIGSALHESLLGQLRQWDAELVRCDALESHGDAVAWLQRRGYTEIQRRYAQRLLLSEVDRAGLSEVEPEGIRITTYAAECPGKEDELLRDIYAVEIAGGEDEPRPEQDIAMSFDRFVSQELQEPGALPDGNFLAYEQQRLVGISRLQASLALPGVLLQGFTTVHASARGRGIAQALKVRTLRYGLEHGYREIRTANDLTNAPMLHINESLGFRPMALRVTFERSIGSSA